jgi:hypothetical protein
MNDNNRDNVIQFPIKPRVQHVLDKVEDLYFEEINDRDQAIDMAHYIFDIMAAGFSQQDWIPGYEGLDFKNTENMESHDMLVILNCISAMLLRYKGYKHMLHEDMDYIRSKLETVSAAQNAESEFEDDWDE